MKADMRNIYRKSDDFRRYLMTNRERVKELEDDYNSNKKFFGKSVLDICCGGGILGFIIEPKGHQYTGADINPDMISSASYYAKSIGSKNKFILGDVTKMKFRSRFDTITFLGNGLTHLTTEEFSRIITNLEKSVHKGSYFVIDYRDVVYMLFKRIWKNKFVSKSRVQPITVITKGIDTNTGEIFQESFDKDGKKKVEYVQTVWSQFIIEPLMKAYGWKLISRNPVRIWTGWRDVYKKVK